MCFYAFSLKKDGDVNLIAIKKLTEEDEQAFSEFLKTERRALPKLHIAPLPFPHETLAVFHKLRTDNLAELAQSCDMTLTKVNTETTVLAYHPLFENSSGKYAFSGYVLKDGKLTFGAEELASSDLNLKEIGGVRRI